MEGSEVSLLVEKLRTYIIHEDVWVMNGEGMAFGHPIDRVTNNVSKN